MDLDRLRQFLIIVEAGSLQAAAQKAHLTQPALSRMLQRLEGEMGVPLFKRVGRRLVPLDAGRVLADEARALLAQQEQLIARVRSTQHGEPYQLRLGVIDSVATYLCASLTETLREAFPRLRLHLTTARSSELLRRIDNGTLDVAVVAHSGPPHVGSEHIAPYQLRFFGRRDRFPNLAACKTDRDLLPFPRVEIDPGGEVPADTPFSARASNIATVKALVLGGFGVGDLVDFVLTPEERQQLVAAAIPHDARCGLFAVYAPSFTGPGNERLFALLLSSLRQQLKQRTHA